MSNVARQMLIHLIFIPVTAIVVFATYARITHPFGFTFWLAVFAVIASLVGYLLYIARVIKTKMPIVNKLTTAVAVVILPLGLAQKLTDIMDFQSPLGQGVRRANSKLFNRRTTQS
jgi:hypothetical protein